MENIVKAMFDQTYESFCRDAYPYQGNYQFLKLLDYLMEALKSLNNTEDLIIYKSEFSRIESKVKQLFNPKKAPAYFSKVKEINDHIVDLREDTILLSNQSGFKVFFNEKYSELYNQTLREKENSLILDKEWARASQIGQACGLSPWLFLE